MGVAGAYEVRTAALPAYDADLKMLTSWVLIEWLDSNAYFALFASSYACRGGAVPLGGQIFRDTRN